MTRQIPNWEPPFDAWTQDWLTRIAVVLLTAPTRHVEAELRRLGAGPQDAAAVWRLIRQIEREDPQRIADVIVIRAGTKEIERWTNLQAAKRR